jgi:hypothetical protein
MVVAGGSFFTDKSVFFKVSLEAETIRPYKHRPFALSLASAGALAASASMHPSSVHISRTAIG